MNAPDPGLTWSPFRQWRERRKPPEPEPEQPETDTGPISPDPDQGKGNTGGAPRPPVDMNRIIRRAAGIEDYHRPHRPPGH